jgi:hypothetical protein
MSRKLSLSLAAVGTLAFVALVTGPANAKSGNGNQGPHQGPHQGQHQGHQGHEHHHAHIHIRHIYERGYIRPVRYALPVVSSGPCTCLTKDYTPEGIVVFKDLCTKEMASAPVDDSPAQASEVQAPTSFAGKTYQDYLAANPQAKSAEPQKN